MSSFFARTAALLLMVLVTCSAARAQYWPASKILEAVRGPVVVGKDKDGKEVARFQKAAVERASAVLDRVSPALGLQTPPLFITKGEEPNAFVTLDKDRRPVMVINASMLQLVGDDDELMAALVGHELGHLRAEHLTKGAQSQAIVGALGALLGTIADVSQAKRGVDTGGLGRQVGGLGAGLVNAKFSRDQEREADSLGVEAMAKAGYNPLGAARLFKSMSARTNGGSGLWLDSHPSHSEREAAMTVMASSLQPTYAANKPAPTQLPDVADPYPTSTFTKFDPTPAEVEAGSAYQRGRAAYVEHRFSDALGLLKPLAEAGDERALTMLGGMALEGQGQPVDVEGAKQHFIAAAAKGFGPAIGALGNMQISGRGYARDPAAAMRLFVLADKRGYPRATAMLASMYAEGNGVPKDAVFARSLAARASASNDPLGRALFGVMLRDGIGGSADPGASYALIEAASAELPWAKYQLGVSRERGVGTAADSIKAIEAYREAAAAGVLPAKASLKRLNAE
jgi:hypothetical protein